MDSREAQKRIESLERRVEELMQRIANMPVRFSNQTNDKKLHLAILDASLSTNGSAAAHYVSNSSLTFTAHDAGFVTTTLVSGTAVWVDDDKGTKYVIAAACP